MAQYGGAPAWVEPIYEMGAALLYRLEFGIIPSDDIEPPWDDVVVAVKAGFEAAKASAAKGGGGGSKRPTTPTKIASQSERQAAIAAAQKRLAGG